MWFPDPEKHPELYRDAVRQVQEKILLRRAMEDELLLLTAGFEPESIAGVGEVWITPGCGCIRTGRPLCSKPRSWFNAARSNIRRSGRSR